MRVRVTTRAASAADVGPTEWIAFTGEVVAIEGPPSVAVGTRVAGFGPAEGGEIRVPAWGIAPVPPLVAEQDAALLPLAGVAARAVRLVSARVGERVQVIGTGLLAGMVAQAFRSAGVHEVSVVDAPGRDLPPVVIDTTGDPLVIRDVLERMPRLGRLALAGPSRGRTADIDFYRTVHQRGLEVIGVHALGPLSEAAHGVGRERDLAGAVRIVEGSAVSARSVGGGD